MKILPVNLRVFPSANKLNASQTPVVKLFFNGKNDSFERKNSCMDKQITELENDVNNKVLPYIEEHREKFVALGKVGYESQEKLKLVRVYETELMNKKFGAGKNETFQNASQNARIYEQYDKNIKEFERNERFVHDHPEYASDELLQAIKKGREKVYRDCEEFEKLRPHYEKSQEIREQMDSELSDVSSAALPEFHEKIKQLDMQNKNAVMLFLVSGYTDAQEIKKDTVDIVQEYKENKVSYDILKRLEKVNYKIQKFEEDDKTAVMESIDNFLEENQNSDAADLTEDEINKTYKTLLEKTDEIILKYTGEIAAYNEANPVKISPRIMDRTFKSQEKINKTISKLIQKEKEKFYSSLNNY